MPFTLIEDVPVFPGCKGNNKELKACFNKKMQKHFNKKFDAELPTELGLSSGRKRLTMQFRVDQNGDVVDIKALAPHPRLKKEVMRVVSRLPKMKPSCNFLNKE